MMCSPATGLLVRYTADGLPLSVSGKDWYGSETIYSPYGQVLRSTLGAHPYRVWTMASYDDASGALTRQQIFREVKGNHLVSNRGYWYDAAGNVTAIREYATPIAERQCFAYDPRGQLLNAWTSQDQASCSAGPGTAAAPNAAAGVDGTGYWQEYEYDLLGNRTKLVERDLTGRTSTGPIATTYEYGHGVEGGGAQPRTLNAVKKSYTTPQGAAIVSEAKRLYELTGETKSVTSTRNGDQQELSWTYDGQVERITGSGSKGRTAYMGLAAKCMDLSQRLAQPNQPIQLYSCNGGAWQKWAFTPTPDQNNGNLGTLSVYDDKWCAQPAGTTAGSVLRLQACDDTAGQQFERLPSTAQLKHAASGLCLAAQDGASADNTPIVLVTCASGSAAQQWNPQDETRHIYGPGGTRLLTVQGRQATLNLGEAQLTVHPGGSPIDAQRTYSTPGGAVLRHVAGTSQQPLTVVAGDHQGSPYAEVNLSGVMEARIRKQDPFGNVRTGAVSGYLRTNMGFLGAVRDDASGFVPLGARLYDPEVGRFLSVDPVLDLTDPVQNNGFTYAHNNPVTHSDPSGLSVSLTPSEMAAALAGAGLSTAMVAQAQADSGRSLTSVILSAAWDVLKEFIGINDAMSCFGGDLWGCGKLILNAIPPGKVLKTPKVIGAINRTIGAIMAWRSAKRAAEAVLSAARAAQTAALNAKKLAIERAKKAAQAADKRAAAKVNTTSNRAVNESKKTGNPVQKEAQARSNPKASSAASTGRGGGGGGKGDSKPGGTSGASKRSNGGTSGNNAGSAGGESCPISNSFVPGTKILMADGSTKPIEDVKPGDEVVVTDPATGRTDVDTVTATITGDGAKQLVKVTIDTDGDQGTKVSEVTATDGHPFWVPKLGEWIDATDLQAGQWLQTSVGTYVQITAIDRWSVPRATVHNLTVANTHTYYVVARHTSLLVHNCPPGFFGKLFSGKPSPEDAMDARFRSEAKPVRLGDLRHVKTPDYGTPAHKANDVRDMHDDVLLEAINDPNTKVATIRIYNGVVEEGNHRMRETLNRLANPNNKKFNEDTMVRVINVVD
ncbi:ricin-type beta-trefoil lectin domain protein [Micromonospora fiedleri]|uniref:Ricin-type beta-trefoil lectin domain protein n=1 Tax=Micromonospora fiedleri TaxID=1157498 RepID=A0ABS1UES7_9ACTN|nr:ricin-type beta-trefoil lectin domain protein [Micromonospora fiedleri]